MKPFLLTAALLAALPALAQIEAETTEALLDRYLAEKGGDISACFAEMPQMRGMDDPEGFRAAEAPAEVPPRRLVLTFDASGSMAARLGSGTRMEAARQAVDGLLDGMPEDVELGLVAFGHQGTNDDAGRAASCAGVETLIEIGSAGELRARVAALEPAGWTPLADALRQAGAQLAAAETPGEQVVYVVSDGQETCGGDPVAEARALHEGEIRAVIHILGFDLPADERAQLQAVAEAGGGVFTEIRSESDLARRIDELRRRNANAGQLLRVQNQAAGTSLRNANQAAGALLKLDNCIAGRALREQNWLRAWGREAGLSEDQLQAVRDALTKGHDAYRTVAAAIRVSLEAERDAANDTIRRQREGAEAAFEAVR